MANPMTSALSALGLEPTRDRFELTLGRAQMRALRFALTRATGLRLATVTVTHRGHRLTVPYYARGVTTRRRVVPVLMVHGFGANKDSWLLMTAGLPRRRPVVIIDVPGFGDATPIPPSLATPAAQSQAMQTIIDALGLAQVDLLGNSMGGGVSLRLCHDAIDRVRSLVLLNSLGPGHLAGSEYARMLEDGDNALIPEDEDAAGRMLDMVAEKKPRLPRALLRHVTAEHVAARDQLAAMFQGWMTSSPEDAVPTDLGAIDRPALVVCGARDRIIAPATGEAMARALPRARLEVFPDLGHIPQLEAPVRTARLLERFWAGL